MNKFFMLTRGRTGSTAILDELGTTNIFALQEVFTDDVGEERKHVQNEVGNSTLPFELWMEPAQIAAVSKKLIFDRESILVNLKNGLNQILKLVCKHVPIFRGNSWVIGRVIERYLLNQYLEYIENIAFETNRDGIVFKVLSHQITTRRPLLGVLKRRGYKAILLVRKNVVRQVISGMIAEQRGVFNTKKFISLPSCEIDLDRFEFSVSWELTCNEANRAILKQNNVEYIEISYEDFSKDRDNLYRKIFSYMGVSYQSPQITSYSIMIPDIKSAITNFEELESKVSAMFSLH
jgi:hypothetical protein